jgi:asparagine synthase (glutamine-hydrolysing)
MPPLLDFLEKVNTILAPYGPDNCNSYHKDGVSVLYRAFHTTKESRRENQPHISQSGAVITWDGRLDNRAEFIRGLTSPLSSDSADVSIVAAAYDRWGTDCFAKLVGDWTLSIWNPHEQALLLAKDPIGTRHLYYSTNESQIAWSTILDALVLFTGTTFALNEEYIAGWFSFFPTAHLTPYIGIDSVPPSCFVRLERGRQTISKYWDFDAGKRIHYRTDTEYEEHFRAVFTQAVQRRLRSDTPILAELSGGMDSSSIVCMADSIIVRGGAETPRLDTLSYYNDSEPNWNERPYFTKVEEQRGRTGCHIDVDTQKFLKPSRLRDTFAAMPGAVDGRATEPGRQFAACVTSQGNRVVLSGIGGDEVTGGVPTPVPQLMDLLARMRLNALARELRVWALNKRKPWLQLFLDVARGFFPSALGDLPKQLGPAAWLRPTFVKRHRAALAGYRSRVKLFGPIPSFQENLSALEALRRQLACSPLSSDPCYEKRYPYLDRDLLEFMYAIPREQLLRPGQRRSLMRRALAGIVPDDILNRKRKAFVTRSAMVAILKDWANLKDVSEQMVSASLGIIDPHSFSEILQKARDGMVVPTITLMRTLSLESWLRTLQKEQVLGGHASTFSRTASSAPSEKTLNQSIAGEEFS